MRTKRTTLSFLTESKASHVSLSSIRRVAITLLVMLLTTASAIAENNYWLTLDPNYEGGASTMVPVSISANTITLTKILNLPVLDIHSMDGQNHQRGLSNIVLMTK